MQYLLEHFAVAVRAITGVLAAKGKRVDLFGVVVLAIVTAVGGGTIRDVLTGEIPLVFQKQIYLYATAALVGATVYIGSREIGTPQPHLRLISIGTILLLRLAAIRWKLALPEFHSKGSLDT